MNRNKRVPERASLWDTSAMSEGTWQGNMFKDRAIVRAPCDPPVEAGRCSGMTGNSIAFDFSNDPNDVLVAIGAHLIDL